MKWVLGCVLLACAVFVAELLNFNLSGSSMRNLQTLARAGAIHETAPVKTSVEITVDAPPEAVWRLLTKINDWPKWQPAISKAEVRNGLAADVDFNWTTGGNAIRSRIELFEPVTRLAWVGTAFDARAVHVWTLQALPGHKSLIKTTESMDGILLSLFYSSSDLKESDQNWLNALKTAAEREPSGSVPQP